MRLAAAQTVYNIGKDTLLEFLKLKGFDVSDKPTTKLTEEMCNALEEQYGNNKRKIDDYDSFNMIPNYSMSIINSDIISKRLPLLSELMQLSKKTEKSESELNRYNLLEIISETDKNATKLDLSNLGLKTIPAEIVVFEKIEEINLSNNEISYISNINILTNIKKLNLSYNKISDISFIRKLTKLEILHISNNKISNIKELPESLLELDISHNQLKGNIKIENLKRLNISNNRGGLSKVNLNTNINNVEIEKLIISNNELINLNQFLRFPKLKVLKASGNLIQNADISIIKADQLDVLDLSYNKIADIKFKENFSIKTLYLENNNINNIDFLDNLLISKQLGLSSNQIKDIEKFEAFLKRNPDLNIYLQDNPIDAIKIDQDYNVSCTELLKEYFIRIITPVQTEQKHFLQLLVLGNGEAGKTSLIRTLIETHKRNGNNIDNEIILPNESTHGNIHYYWNIEIEGKKYTILIKDFGGQEYYHHFHPMFYDQKGLYFIVDSLFKEDDQFKLVNGNHNPQYWINNIEYFLNLFHQSQISKEELENNIWLFRTKIDKREIDLPRICNKEFKICCKIDDSNQDKYSIKKFEAYQNIAYYEFINKIAQISSTSYLEISLKIYDLLLNKSNNIDIDNFMFIIRTIFLEDIILKLDNNININEIASNRHTILMDLKSLGIILYFPGVEKISDYFILFPQKFSEYIFKTKLDKSLIDIGLTSFIEDTEIDFLKHFEIVFQDGQTQKYIIPEYLPNQNEAQDLINLASDGFKYKLCVKFNDFLPQGLISKLMCYFGTNPHKKWYWRNGIFFTHKLSGRDFQALIVKVDNIIEINSNEELALEYLFEVLLLAYYNYDLSIVDNNDDENSDVYRQYNDFSNKLKNHCINISLKINENTEYDSLEFFKKTIKNIEKEFHEFHNLKAYQKIKEYAPYISKFIDIDDNIIRFNPQKVFISYSHKDIEIAKNLKSHLKLIENSNWIKTWFDLNIEVGTKWDEKIEKELAEADIIILLLSSDFFDSKYIWNKELPIIEKKIVEGSAKVIPVLCRHCITSIKDLFNSKKISYNLGNLQGLPFDSNKGNNWVPIKSDHFKYEDEALVQIAEKIKQIIDGI